MSALGTKNCGQQAKPSKMRFPICVVALIGLAGCQSAPSPRPTQSFLCSTYANWDEAFRSTTSTTHGVKSGWDTRQRVLEKSLDGLNENDLKTLADALKNNELDRLAATTPCIPKPPETQFAIELDVALMEHLICRQRHDLLISVISSRPIAGFGFGVPLGFNLLESYEPSDWSQGFDVLLDAIEKASDAPTLEYLWTEVHLVTYGIDDACDAYFARDTKALSAWARANHDRYQLNEDYDHISGERWRDYVDWHIGSPYPMLITR